MNIIWRRARAVDGLCGLQEPRFSYVGAPVWVSAEEVLYVRGLLSLLLIGPMLVAACSSGSSEDCPGGVRYQSVVYIEVARFTSGPAERVGVGDEASCDDTGEDAQGVFFADDAQPIDVWSFHGYDLNQVVGVRLSENRFSILLARDLPADEVSVLMDSELLTEGSE